MKEYPGITMVRQGLKGSGVPPINVVEWMALHGHTGYKTKIEAAERLMESADEKKAAHLRQEIEEIISEAQDRFEDWASD